MQPHDSPHDLAGRFVVVASGFYAGQVIRIEDWFDRAAGLSWMQTPSHAAALHYAFRAAYERLPLDNEVLIGRIGWDERLIHASEAGQPVAERATA